jgi:hypothetical protein
MDECYCDYERPDAYSACVRKARKRHKCNECLNEIVPGDRYEHAWAVYSGEIMTFDTCPRCLALREHVQAHVPCFCWAHRSMLDDAMQTVESYRHESPELWEEVSRLNDAVWEKKAKA